MNTFQLFLSQQKLCQPLGSHLAKFFSLLSSHATSESCTGIMDKSFYSMNPFLTVQCVITHSLSWIFSHPLFQSTILETKSCTVWICILHRRLYWWPSESICFCKFMEWISLFKKNLTLSVVGDSRELTVDVQWTYSTCTSTCRTCSVSTANIHHSVVVQNAIWSQKGCNKGSAIW